MTPPDDSLTDPDWSDPEWSAPETGAPRRGGPAGTARARPDPSAGRAAALVAVATVVVVVTMVAAVARFLPHPGTGCHRRRRWSLRPGPTPRRLSAPAGTGTAATTTDLPDQLDPTDGPRGHDRGRDRRHGGAVPTTHQQVSVPPLGSLAVDPVAGSRPAAPPPRSPSPAGAWSPSRPCRDPSGWSTAPCPSLVSSQWDFAGGSTAAGNTLTLSLYNPAAVEAVVNVTFLTESGVIAPQQYQGLVVPAGQLVDENVGDFVQGQDAIATMVDVPGRRARRHRVPAVVGRLHRAVPEGGLAVALDTWRFAQTTALAQSTVDVTLANPGPTPATATISLGLSSGSVVPHQLVVAPASVTDFSASGTAGLPEQVPYSLTVASSAPIVVGRSVEAPSGSAQPGWGSSSATVTVAARWLVPGPGIPARPARPTPPSRVWPWPIRDRQLSGWWWGRSVGADRWPCSLSPRIG